MSEDSDIPGVELTQWRVGRVLSDRDIELLTRYMREVEDFEARQVDTFAEGRDQALRELGGQELVDLVEKRDSLACQIAWEKAKASVALKQAALDALTPTPPPNP